PFNVSAATLIIYHVVLSNASFIFRKPFISLSQTLPVRFPTTLNYNNLSIHRKATPNRKINNQLNN
ncbi:hypothetical protein, partial [Paenibacillus sp. VTT E-133280]|uniref:hypothetical protein n=1 Tax=Paenibacillus sp. VTT E-133280 TaxID=1986222 RepID=UPI001C532E87